MSPEQCRAARAWLDWSQDKLAAKAQVSNSTLREFEAGRRLPIANNLAAIRRALENAGIEFLFARDDERPWGIARRRDTGRAESIATDARQRTPKRTRG